jgi:hypothetical protein
VLLERAVRFLPLVLIVALAGAARGQEEGTPEPGLNSIEIQVGYFDMDDSGEGNPFLDESLTVIEPVVIFDFQVTQRLAVATELSYDFVSSASIDRLSQYAEQSGASGDYYYGADVGFRFDMTDRVTLGWHLGGSVEYDYTSFGVGGSLSVEAEDRNSSWTVSLEAFQDEVDIIRWNGMGAGSDDRTSIAATLSHYRVLSPTVHADFGLTFANQSGFLETPYNFVVFETPGGAPNLNLANQASGVEMTEELPDDRNRMALFGRLRKHLAPGHAVELGGRLYNDSWGINSIAIEPQYLAALGKTGLLSLRYRYYDQSEADDFDDQFLMANPVPNHRTQDSDLGAFSSNTLGARIDWNPKGKSRWSLSFDYIMRSDGLDHLMAALGWKRSF